MSRGHGSSQVAELRCREDDGAVAVVVALTLVVLLGFGALAIDLGSAWVTKRDLVTDLDAAALAGAQVLGEIGYSQCESSDGPIRSAVNSVAGLNDPDTQITAIDIDCDLGTVQVTGSKESEIYLAAVLGQTELRPGGFSTAVVSLARGGVMPIAICNLDPSVDLFDQYQAGTLSEEDYFAVRGSDSEFFPASNPALSPDEYYPDRVDGVVHRVNMQKVWKEGSACPDAGAGPGNWGWLDLGGKAGKGGEDSLYDHVANGYSGSPVTVGVDAQCADSDAAPGYCDGETGNVMKNVTDRLRDNWACSTTSSECDRVVFIVYDSKTGPGSNVEYRLTGLLEAVVWDARGDLDKGNAQGYMDIEPTQYITSGNSSQFERVSSARLCGADPAGAQNTCGG